MKKRKLVAFLILILFVIQAMPLVMAKSYGWGVSKNDNHEQPDIGFYKEEIANTASYYVGGNDEKVIYLTFDAGYDNGNLEKILKTLAEKNVKSTFFVTGDFLCRETDLVRDIVEGGHTIGNHTWSHKNITTLSDSELKEELVKVEDKYYEITGEAMTKYFRPPAGEFNNASLEKVSKYGYNTFFWSIAYQDWQQGRGVDYVYHSVMDNLHNGAIILMHTVSEDNSIALGNIIDDIRNQGYEIKNLDYLVDKS